MVYYKYVLIIDTNLPVSKEDMKRAAQSWLNGLNIPDTEFILKLKSKLDNKKMFKCVNCFKKEPCFLTNIDFHFNNDNKPELPLYCPYNGSLKTNWIEIEEDEEF